MRQQISCSVVFSKDVNDLFISLLFYIAFNSQGHIKMGSLQVEEISAYCTVNRRASASNYQLSNIKRPAPRFELVASEVGGENSNRYTTEPPKDTSPHLPMQAHNHTLWAHAAKRGSGACPDCRIDTPAWLSHLTKMRCLAHAFAKTFTAIKMLTILRCTNVQHAVDKTPGWFYTLVHIQQVT